MLTPVSAIVGKTAGHGAENPERLARALSESAPEALKAGKERRRSQKVREDLQKASPTAGPDTSGRQGYDASEDGRQARRSARKHTKRASDGKFYAFDSSTAQPDDTTTATDSSHQTQPQSFPDTGDIGAAAAKVTDTQATRKAEPDASPRLAVIHKTRRSLLAASPLTQRSRQEADPVKGALQENKIASNPHTGKCLL